MRHRTTAVTRDRRVVTTPDCQSPKPEIDDAVIAVQSEWNGWRTAMVRVSALDNLHWAQPAGAPRPLINAVVDCDRLPSGRIAHACDRTSAPHRLSVCILKSHTQAAVFQELARRAGGATTCGVSQPGETRMLSAKGSESSANGTIARLVVAAATLLAVARSRPAR